MARRMERKRKKEGVLCAVNHAPAGPVGGRGRPLGLFSSRHAEDIRPVSFLPLFPSFLFGENAPWSRGDRRNEGGAANSAQWRGLVWLRRRGFYLGEQMHAGNASGPTASSVVQLCQCQQRRRRGWAVGGGRRAAGGGLCRLRVAGLRSEAGG